MLSITKNHVGQRIDNFLLARLKGVPRSKIYRIIRKGEVRVNKKRVKPEYKLQNADVVRVPPVRLPTPSVLAVPSESLQELLKEAILYQDDALLIVNKPSGIAVHGGTGIRIGLIEALRFMYPQEFPLELVHRLDKGTSGCLMIAKDPLNLRKLNAALKAGRMQKTYHAIVVGSWPKEDFQVDQPLLKHQPRSGERFVEVSPEGKKALTKFRFLHKFQQHSLIEAQPVTGRTHQIRVHAKFVGNPISGDEKYSSDKDNLLLRKLGVSRLCLHAAEISLPHPATNRMLTVSAPYDKNFEKAIKVLKNS